MIIVATTSPAIDLKLGHVEAQVSPGQSISAMFKEKVEAKTNGEVTITIFDNGTLGNEKNLQQMVRSSIRRVSIRQ